MKKLLTTLFVALYTLGYSQCVDFNFQPNVMIDQVKVDVRVSGFVDVVAIQFGIEYNAGTLTLDSLGNFNLLGLDNFNFNPQEPGEVKLSYVAGNPLQGITLSDNSTLFSLYFTIDGTGSTNIDLMPNEDFIIEIINSNFEILCHSSQPGVIFAEGSAISGVVSLDENDNCEYDAGEVALGGWKVHLQSSQYDLYRITREDGSYDFIVPAGDYSVELIPLNNLWAVCPNPDVINVPDNDQEYTVNLSSSIIEECVRMNVDISTSFLRRCFSNTYHVSYQNSGTAVAEDAYIEVELDPFMLFLGTSAMSYSEFNGIYTFPLGDLDIGASGSFNIIVELLCEGTMIGQTHCVTAHAYPDIWCEPSPEWNGANLELDAVCDGDSVRFTITNTSLEGMIMPTEFIVVEDDVMLESSPLQLDGGQTYMAAYPANGSTYRMQAQQVSNHPSEGYPVATVEACGDDPNAISLGFVTMFSEGDNDPFISIDCQENIGSYDPNDKRSYPKGYQDAHLIKANTDIEYLIRFQNTGTDTAFNVVIEDRLSENLDIESIRGGAASHKYTLDIKEDRTLVFSFKDILLVDSTTNEAASHGFVKLLVSQMPDLADGELILNDANIFFDFNDPILTNMVDLKIGSDFVEVVSATIDPLYLETAIVQPNPSVAGSEIIIDDKFENSKLDILIYGVSGQIILKDEMLNATYMLESGILDQGLYLFQIREGSEIISAGKIIIQ